MLAEEKCKQILTNQIDGAEFEFEIKVPDQKSIIFLQLCRLEILVIPLYCKYLFRVFHEVMMALLAVSNMH